ncbi:hypothetical protein [Endozoicomonas sp. 8E]|uniref:hypothetical protein n=1 Tax=Endozoicomonas sp. 8E TaxID=3035692 RepID=UPI00293932E1|nr:hypothetical protein [Endozoicomonas sp. 8E]WOG28566.1 hypothetical protein P6910_02615 [Endozoicomonas sp. 8E]
MTARFQITALNTLPDMRLRPSNFIEMGARSKAYFGPEPPPEKNDHNEQVCVIGDLIEQTRRCVDLFDGGLDKGLSEYLPYEPTPPSQD